jgi:hypothetical protein
MLLFFVFPTGGEEGGELEAEEARIFMVEGYFSR